jgi:hypothetical protein
MASTYAGKLADPGFRSARARKAGKAAHSLDHYVRHIVDRAGELTGEQVDQLRALLPAAPDAQDAA